MRSEGLFSPSHLAMYMGAVIAGVFSGGKVLAIHFWGNFEEKASSINFTIGLSRSWGIQNMASGKIDGETINGAFEVEVK